MSCATSVAARAPLKIAVWLPEATVPPPLTAMSAGPRFESASSAASICAAVALKASGAVVCPAEGQRERAAGRVVDADRLLLVGLLVVEGPEAARAAAAGRRVVTRDQPQVVVLVEVDVARDVAAGATVVRDLHDLLLGRQVQRRRRAVDELEARELEVSAPVVGPVARISLRRLTEDVRAAGRVRGRGHVLERAVALLEPDGRGRVEQVHPLVGGEVVVDRAAVEAVLGVRVDRDVRDDRRGLRDRVVEADLAGARGLDDAPVGELVEADRLVQVRRGGDLGLLVVGEHGRAAVAVDRVGLAGRPQHGAAEVLAQVGLGEARGRVAERGVEGPAALVVLAPDHGMVGAG